MSIHSMMAEHDSEEDPFRGLDFADLNSNTHVGTKIAASFKSRNQKPKLNDHKILINQIANDEKQILIESLKNEK